MKDIRVQFSAHNLIAIFKRYHLTFFIIFITAILSGTVLLINNVVVNPSAEETINSTTGSTNTGADFSIMQSFHGSDELKSPPTLPAGRVNPFTTTE